MTSAPNATATGKPALRAGCRWLGVGCLPLVLWPISLQIVKRRADRHGIQNLSASCVRGMARVSSVCLGRLSRLSSEAGNPSLQKRKSLTRLASSQGQTKETQTRANSSDFLAGHPWLSASFYQVSTGSGTVAAFTSHSLTIECFQAVRTTSRAKNPASHEMWSASASPAFGGLSINPATTVRKCLTGTASCGTPTPNHCLGGWNVGGGDSRATKVGLRSRSHLATKHAAPGISLCTQPSATSHPRSQSVVGGVTSTVSGFSRPVMFTVTAKSRNVNLSGGSGSIAGAQAAGLEIVRAARGFFRESAKPRLAPGC